MEWLIRFLGAFYVAGGLLLLRNARMEWFLNKAIERITRTPEADCWHPVLMAMFAVIYLVAGTALLALSSLAIWLLGFGLISQAAYYPVMWHLADQEERRNQTRWRAARNAAIFSAAAFALSAYACRTGVLS